MDRCLQSTLEQKSHYNMILYYTANLNDILNDILQRIFGYFDHIACQQPDNQNRLVVVGKVEVKKISR